MLSAMTSWSLLSVATNTYGEELLVTVNEEELADDDNFKELVVASGSDDLVVFLAPTSG